MYDFPEIKPATGAELDNLGTMVGMRRRPFESDEQFRERIRTYVGSGYTWRESGIIVLRQYVIGTIGNVGRHLKRRLRNFWIWK